MTCDSKINLFNITRGQRGCDGIAFLYFIPRVSELNKKLVKGLVVDGALHSKINSPLIATMKRAS